MIATKKQLLDTEKHLQQSIDFNRDEYWKLYHKYEALLEYLGLREVEIQRKLTFEKKSF